MKVETIIFQETHIPCVQNEYGEVFVAVKTICDAIGLDYERAKRNIKEHPVLSAGMSVQTYQVGGQGREMVCLNLDYIHGWLFSISANHVRKEIRPNLLTYQRECYKVLKDHYFGEKKTESNNNHEMQIAAFQALQARRAELYEAMRTAQREIYHVEKRLHEFDFDHPEQTQLKIDFTVSVSIPMLS